MLCISKYTDDTYAQYFGDRRHKFYLEFRCNQPCLKGTTCCTRCSVKSSTTKIQHSRKFNHGNVNEPIPDNSHIFGGKWYEDGLRKWGNPPSEIIEFAQQYQRKARNGLNDEDIKNANDVCCDTNNLVSQETNVDSNELINTPIKKKGRKPRVATSSSDTVSSTDTSSIISSATGVKVTKRTRKPRIASNTDVSIELSYKHLVNSTNMMHHKEVTIPTHIETSLEELDTNDFNIEYVQISMIEINNTSYFIDRNKYKLYKKVKDKIIGQYIGRWNPDNDTINSDIPDSDDE